MKLLKLEYTPLKVGLSNTDVLKLFSDLDVKISRKSSELLLSFSKVILMFSCFEFK